MIRSIVNVSKCAFSSSILAPLRERGLIESTTGEVPETVKSAYVGFDPTASSLHIGNLQALIIMGHLWVNNVQPIILLGGATGYIGDPSGRDHERPLLNTATLNTNLEAIRTQIKSVLEKLRESLSRKTTSPKAFPEPILLDNREIYEKMSVLDFMKCVGRHIRVNSLLNRETIKKRLDKAEGLSYQEFSYQLFQAHDFLWIYDKYGCKLQVGGSDQWGNICTGCDLVRKIKGQEVFGVTYPLLTNSKGEKYSKSTGNAVPLDSKQFSPYEFYQFFYNIPDEDCERLLTRLTLLGVPEIKDIMKEHEKDKEKRLAQKILAQEVTALVHGGSVQEALKSTELLFHTDVKRLKIMSPAELDKELGNCNKVMVEEKDMQKATVSQLMLWTKTVKSRSEARRLITNRAVQINGERVDSDIEMQKDWLLVFYHENENREESI